MPDWIPGWERREITGVSGGSWADDLPDRVVLHKTEGSSIEGAEAAYGRTRDEPHGTLDLSLRRAVQHLPLSRSATAVRNLAGGVETNRVGRTIQLEIVGFSAHSGSESDDELRFLARCLVDIERAGVTFTFDGPAQHPYPPENGIRLDGREPWRFTFAEWLSFNGVCGHQNVPENVHGDPGALDMPKVYRFAEQTLNPTEDHMPVPLVQLEGDTAVWCVGPAGRWYVGHPRSVALLGVTGVVNPAIIELKLADGGKEALEGIAICAPPAPATLSAQDIADIAAAIHVPGLTDADVAAVARVVASLLGAKLSA